ncbi:serine protease [Mycobacterium sp. M1]|uniref:Serine protease n=1 Tax=Mycolicibacter acidiphilus TaxID=2835306 RepID=A0ABS5RMB0_9MYCO|nr:serine protease [Mycolicibacter acidiphilus]MBS9534683.1 serine protease [Mycolicibacter acidiphilus]
MRIGYRVVAGWAVALSVMGTPAAGADGAVILGGGAAITVGAEPCTLTTIGTDGGGAIVGLTSASCGAPGTPVAAGWAPGELGTVTATSEDLDYAVVTFDRTKVTPTADFAGYPINGIGPDAAPGQQACKNSRESGVICKSVSIAPGADPDTTLLHVCGDPDDAGAPVTVDGLLVGMIRGNFPDPGRCPERRFTGKVWVRKIPLRDRPEITSINAVIADLNARGGAGAGFVPTPG